MRKASSEEDKRSFFTTVNLMEDVHGMGETPCDLTKPRIAPCKNTWKRLQNTVWVQFEARSRERLAILPDTVTCSRSPQHTACSLHWESGVCENSGGALPQGVLNSENATSRAKNPTRNMVHKIHKGKKQDHLGNHRAIRKVTGKLCSNTVDHRISGVPLSAVEPQNTTRENEVKRLIEKFENHKHKESFSQDFEPDAEDQQVQQRIAGLDRRLEQHRDLRTMRKFFQTAMSWLQCLLGNRNNLLQLWKKYQIFAESNEVRPEQPWRHLNPWICDQEKQQSWRQARTFWKTKDVLPGETNAQKGPTGKARTPSNDSFTMVRRRRIQTVTVSNEGGKNTTHHAIRHLRRHKSWKNSKFEAFDSHDKRRRNSAISQSTTRLCSSATENANVCMTSTWQGPKNNTEPFLAANK